MMTEIHLTTDGGSNEFSYEDMGLLRLYSILFVLMTLLFILMIRTFLKFYRTEKTWLAPHPVMIFSLSMIVFSIFFKAIYLWTYSYDGIGSTVSDVLSKIISGFSQVAISILLLTLASGWKLRYDTIDIDDGLELYLPLTLLVLIIHIILIAL